MSELFRLEGRVIHMDHVKIDGNRWKVGFPVCTVSQYADAETLLAILNASEQGAQKPQPAFSEYEIACIKDVVAEVAKQDCQTKGLEDLEPGCCEPCRARYALHTLLAKLPAQQPSEDMTAAYMAGVERGKLPAQVDVERITQAMTTDPMREAFERMPRDNKLSARYSDDRIDAYLAQPQFAGYTSFVAIIEQLRAERDEARQAAINAINGGQ